MKRHSNKVTSALSVIVSISMVFSLMLFPGVAAAQEAAGSQSSSVELAAASLPDTVGGAQGTTLAAASEDDQAAVDAVAASFAGYAFQIRYAKGYTNAADAVKDAMMQSSAWQDGMTVTLKSRDDSDAIDADGTIHYKASAFGYINVTNVSNCVFTVALNGATADTAARTLQVGWDLNYYKAQMQAEADAFDASSMLGENESLSAVLTDLELTGSGGANVGSSWGVIEWTSSNPALIEVKEKDYTSDYVGVVTRPSADDETVTLTATIKANSTKLSNCESQDEIGTITKTFEVTVTGMHKPPVTDERLTSLLDTYYNNPEYANAFINESGTYLDVSQGVESNFSLPRYTNIRTSVDADKLDDWGHVFANKEIAVTSENDSILKINGYAVQVDASTLLEDTTVNLTVTLTREGYTGTKVIPVLVKATITDELLEAEAAKLQLVVDHYWDGINDNTYTSIDEVTGSLHGFQEANVDDENNVTFVYNVNDKTNAGFKPDSYFEDPWEMEGAGYNLFKSSNPAIIQHENLVMPDGAQPADSTKVTISSLISSETYGPMAANHPENEKLQALYKQEASAEVTVLGTKIVAARAIVEALKDPSEITEADRATVQAVRMAYDELTALDKQLFGEDLLGKLEAAEAKLGITKAPAFTSESYTFTVRAGESLNESLEATGIPTPAIAVADDSTLPAWLSLSASGVLEGTAPSEAGTFSFDVKATNTIDGAAQAATATVTVTVERAPEPADPVDVFMSVSDRGALALARQSVTVTDIDGDGVLTFDEALKAAHAAYCPSGAAGYASGKAGDYTAVSKLWGVETGNCLFYRNDAMTTNVGDEPVQAGDDLAASVMMDGTNYSDHYAFFDKKTATVKAGEEFSLNLKAVAFGDPMAAPGVQVGTWAEGAFAPIEGKVTGEDGSVTLSFDTPGTYVVSASGTVSDEVTDWSTGNTQVKDCPLTASVCVVTVETAPAEPVEVFVTVSRRASLALTRQLVTASDLNADGVVSYDEALKAAHELYCPYGADGYASSESTYGLAVTRLWGIDTFNCLFYRNDAAATNVGDEPVQKGDDLVAVVMVDWVSYTDHYAFFDKKQAAVKTGEELSLSLNASFLFGDSMAAPGVKVGTWANGAFTQLPGKMTGADGSVALSFKQPGVYVVTASGTISDVVEDWSSGVPVPVEKAYCPLSKPVCVVTVTGEPIKDENTLSVSAVAATSVPSVTYGQAKTIAAKLAMSVKNAKGAVSYKKVSGNANITVAANGAITVKKGLAPGKYPVKIAVTAAGNDEYKAATKNVTVTLTVIKAANTMTVTAKDQTVKYTTVSSKAVTVTPLTVSNAKGAKAFKVTAWTTAKAKNYFKVNATTGAVTVAKGTPKGTYKFNVQVTAKGNDYYNAKNITKTVVVKVQ